MREIRTSGLMSGDGKRGGASVSVLAPILDSTEVEFWPPGGRGGLGSCHNFKFLAHPSALVWPDEMRDACVQIWAKVLLLSCYYQEGYAKPLRCVYCTLQMFPHSQWS